MALSPSKKKANDKYLKTHYEHITLAYPKGTRDLWKAAAARLGLSLAEFVKAAVNDYISKNGG